MEADSLNAAVLGPDVERESKTYDLFLLEVQREMTQKAGQKCTATRRIFVPEGLVEAVRDDLVEQMRKTRVGCPGPREVTMGPLATAPQLTDVREGIELLSRFAERIHGDDGGAELQGVEEPKGFFARPTLFYAADARKAADVHDHEVFGPAQTLMPYDGTAEEASELVNLGGGGLVAGIYSDDRSFIRRMILACASHHGRLHIAREKIADHSSGSGAVLPQMLHGGPGRAGGGQELGGLRGLELYMQRTAVQGLKPLLEKLLELEPE